MSTLHVAITGRDRRHLTALGPKLRVLVVGYREDEHGAVVDAYIPAAKVGWLERHGYGVVPLEAVDAYDRARQAEGRAAVATRAKRGRYGDVIWGGGYLTTDEVEAALVLGERNHVGYFERIALPHLTWEKRRVHAFRIGRGRAGNGASRSGARRSASSLASMDGNGAARTSSSTSRCGCCAPTGTGKALGSATEPSRRPRSAGSWSSSRSSCCRR